MDNKQGFVYLSLKTTTDTRSLTHFMNLSHRVQVLLGVGAIWLTVVLWVGFVNIPLLSEVTFLRIILTLLVAFVCPGYLLALTLFPVRESLNLVERIGFCLTLSVAIVVFLYLGLYFVGLSLNQQNFLLALLLAIVVLSASSIMRNWSIITPYMVISWSKIEKTTVGFSNKAFWGAMVLLACVGIGALSFASVSWSTNEFFTEFYVLGIGNDNADNASPLTFQLQRYGDFTLVVKSHERMSENYEIHILQDGRVIESMPLTLTPDASWTRSVRIHLFSGLSPHRVQFELFRSGISAPYREVHLWVYQEQIR